MTSRTIAIGDIHGHALALAGLLDAVAPQPDDMVVFLGDYIDRGPDSRGVLQLVLSLSDRCRVVPLMGNHEEMLLQARGNRHALPMWLDNGGDATLRSYDSSDELEGIPTTHVEWLCSLRRYHETERHFFIHANYAPNWRLDQHDSKTSLWLPLTDLPGRHYSGKTAVVGHTPQPAGKILNLGYLLGIDTGCGFGGQLTALDVDSGQTWQVDEQGR
ncbi:MAG: Serine/threonine-protein phosphatase 1 [Planctomycetota bacterium]